MKDKVNLKVDIGGLELENPIMPASGAFGFEMEDGMDFSKLGALVPKSITKNKRGGNLTPRVCEVHSGMINSIGIQSKGIDYYIDHMLPKYEEYNVPIISSISGDTIEEFAELAEMLEKTNKVAALELNISCPNLENNGKAYGMDAEISYDLIKGVKEVTNIPIIAKLTPNVTDITEIAISCEEAGADSLNVANTLLAMAIDIDTRRPKIGNGMGGLSGPGVKPIIVRMIYQVRQVTEVPIIGCGGVMDYKDAIEMIIAGATAVQVGTANFINPNAMSEIIDGIEKYLVEKNIKEIESIVGCVENIYE